MVAKMAKAFGVTVDFLIGEGENASYDKETVERIIRHTKNGCRYQKRPVQRH